MFHIPLKKLFESAVMNIGENDQQTDWSERQLSQVAYTLEDLEVLWGLKAQSQKSSTSDHLKAQNIAPVIT